MDLKVISEAERNESSSLQLIVDVSCVVKELLENALDSGATKIDVSLVDGGCTSIEVRDNGKGITKDDFDLLATRNATSKIREFEDLTRNLQTLGFRGEALNSIAILSTLQIKTRAADSDSGWSLTFDSQGRVLAKEMCTLDYGTIVTCHNLFDNFPVRRIQLVKTWNSKLKCVVEMVQQYTLLNPDIRLTLTNKLTNGKLSLIFSSPGNFHTLGAIASFVYGKKVVSEMKDWSFSCKEFAINGLISDVDSKIIHTIQLLFVNKRPVDSQKLITRGILDVYRHFFAKSKPSFILNLTLNTQEIDFNCSPDKRTVYITIEEYIANAIKIQIHKFLEARVINTKSSSSLLPMSLNRPKRASNESIIDPPSLNGNQSKNYECKQLAREECMETSIVDTVDAGEFNLKRYKVEVEDSEFDKSEEPVFGFESVNTNIANACKKDDKQSYFVDRVLLLNVNEYRKHNRSRQIFDEGKCEAGVLDSAYSENVKRVDKSAFKKMEICGQFNKGFIIAKLPVNSNGRDEFNYSLFIIDQHAADEKAKYEALNKNIKINRQKLIEPVFIRVPQSQLAVARDNLKLLEHNGFNVNKIGENGLYVSSYPILFSRVLGEKDLLELLENIYNSYNSGTYKNELFGEYCENEAINKRDYSESEKHDDDIIEDKVSWDYFESIPRPPRIWSLLANKACKSAVKIGDDLCREKMNIIKNTLSELDHPWNCPHGRPTIKCLATASELEAAVCGVSCNLDFN